MKLVSLTCILASLVALATSSRIIVKEPPSQAPSTDCSTIIYDMMDCVSFLSDGSKVQKPSSSCCSGLESVLSADPDCLCVAIKSSGDMGIELNLTRAAALPSACGVSAPPLSHCNIVSVPPGAAPGTAPSHSPAEPPSESPDIPPSAAPQPSAYAPSPADAPSNDAADNAPAPAKAGAAHSVPAIPVVLISLLLLTLDVGFSFMA